MNKLKKILPIILAFILVFGSCLTVSAEESDDPYNISGLDNLGYYVVIDLDNGNYQYVTTNAPLIYDNSDKGLTGLWTTVEVNYISCQTISTGTWSTPLSGTSNANSFITRLNSTSGNVLVQSNYDVKDKSGNMVFRGPAPLVALAEVLPEKIQSQVTVILTIAIACLALLITLSVLRKKLPIFLH